MISTTTTSGSFFSDGEEEDASRPFSAAALEVIASTGATKYDDIQTLQKPDDDRVNMMIANTQEVQEQHQQELQQPTIISAPSIIDIVKFAIPAIGVYLCSPLLSMIDTSSVGLFCGTLQQAALNPAVTITDYSARTMSFLYTGTTNIMASTRSNRRDSHSSDATYNNNNQEYGMLRDTLTGALRLSFFVGLGLACFLLMTSRRMLVPLIGNDSMDVELLNAAWRYIMIRSLGMPAAAMIGTCQAACLGLKDNQTPFNIIIAAAGINLFLDVLLVGQRRFPWIGGTAGAAWATIFSQYFAVWLFLRNFTRCTIKNHTSTSWEKDDKMKTSSKTQGLLLAEDENEDRSPLPQQLKRRMKSFMKFPSKQTIQNFAPFVVPVTTTQVGRCSTYIAMGHVVSSTMNEVSMAAQQIITSIFYALIPIGDSCSLTAQSFLPSILSSQKRQEATETNATNHNGSNNNNGNHCKDELQQFTKGAAIRKTVQNIYKMAGIMGIFLSMIALSIPVACPLLTSDPAVISTVKSVIPVMLAVLTTHGIFCASEGILLGYRDLKFLGRVYSIFFAVIPMLMFRLKYAARIGGKAVELSSVWNVFLGYQAVRIVAFATRALYLIQKTGKGKDSAIPCA